MSELEKMCPNCNNEIDENWNYCAWCGQRFNGIGILASFLVIFVIVFFIGLALVLSWGAL